MNYYIVEVVMGVSKVAICMQTFNKNDVLPNVLYSIARQKPPFPFELCVIDDGSDESPEPIIRKYFPDAKFKCITEKGPSGPDAVFGHALDLISDDVDVVILQSADVIHVEEYTIEDLVDNVDKKVPAFAQVSNAEVPNDMYQDFGKGIKNIFEQWKVVPAMRRTGCEKGLYFFLGAILKEDTKTLGFGQPLCDVMLQQQLWNQKFRINFLEDLKGIHCVHSESWIPCVGMSTCFFKCKLKNHFLGRWI